MSLRTPEKVERLQAALHAKAKGSPGYRFYTLYDRIARPDVLAAAWGLVAANGGAPGVDGVRIKDIENAPGGVAHGLVRERRPHAQHRHQQEEPGPSHLRSRCPAG